MKTFRLLSLGGFLLILSGCVSVADSPQLARIVEVSRTTRQKGYPPAEQREEFYVAWCGAGIDLVKLEYRQVNSPNEVFAKSYVPTTRRSHVFTVGGEEFLKGGKVSAWRVTLWRNQQLLAEQKSALW